MTQPKAVRLPDLPLLRCVRDGCVAPVLVTALNAIPEILPQVTCRQLVEKYGITKGIAYHVLYNVGPNGDRHA